MVTLTTWERDHVVRKNPGMPELVGTLKAKGNWLVGLHHNWHDYQFHYDPLYDFSMAGEGDLVEATGTKVPLVPMDACNFAPDCFAAPSGAEKFWDVLYVARAVFFKKIPEFFACVRALFDRGDRLRILFLCPVPPEVRQGNDQTVLDVRKLYDSMFSPREQDLFTLLSVEFRYPFPFDLETLAYLYRSSKVFVHFASDERRCRVASYAWASGMPVVAMASVGSLLPAHLRRPPFFYEAPTFTDFQDLILRARDSFSTARDSSVQSRFLASHTVAALDSELARVSAEKGLGYQKGQLAGSFLDIRLGRHHVSPASTNAIGMELSDLLKYLAGPQFDDLARHLAQQDPERSIAEEFPRAIAPKARNPSVLGRLLKRIGTGSAP